MDQPTVKSYVLMYRNSSKLMKSSKRGELNMYDPKKIRNLHQFHNLKENMDAVHAYEQNTLKSEHSLYVRTRSDNFFFTHHPDYFKFAIQQPFVIIPKVSMWRAF